MTGAYQGKLNSKPAAAKMIAVENNHPLIASHDAVLLS